MFSVYEGERMKEVFDSLLRLVGSAEMSIICEEFKEILRHVATTLSNLKVVSVVRRKLVRHKRDNEYPISIAYHPKKINIAYDLLVSFYLFYANNAVLRNMTPTIVNIPARRMNPLKIVDLGLPIHPSVDIQAGLFTVKKIYYGMDFEIAKRMKNTEGFDLSLSLTPGINCHKWSLTPYELPAELLPFTQRVAHLGNVQPLTKGTHQGMQRIFYQSNIDLLHGSPPLNMMPHNCQHEPEHDIINTRSCKFLGTLLVGTFFYEIKSVEFSERVRTILIPPLYTYGTQPFHQMKAQKKLKSQAKQARRRLKNNLKYRVNKRKLERVLQEDEKEGQKLRGILKNENSPPIHGNSSVVRFSDIVYYRDVEVLPTFGIRTFQDTIKAKKAQFAERVEEWKSRNSFKYSAMKAKIAKANQELIDERIVKDGVHKGQVPLGKKENKISASKKEKKEGIIKLKVMKKEVKEVKRKVEKLEKKLQQSQEIEDTLRKMENEETTVKCFTCFTSFRKRRIMMKYNQLQRECQMLKMQLGVYEFE